MTRSTQIAWMLFSFGAFTACGSDPFVGTTVVGSKRDGGVSIYLDAAATNQADASLVGNADAGYEMVITFPPRLQLDLVFMVDNSPSMAPKQKKLTAQFPNLIQGLKNPYDGTLPDLRIAIIDSDLGTGGAYPSGSCGPKNGSNYGDMGKFQMINAAACGVTSPDSLFLEYKKGAPVNYTGDLSAVFGCLVGNLGTLGCGEEHSLEAFEFALAAKGVGNETQQQAFLRPNAYLFLVFLTDEDDCSAATNDGMFGTRPGDTDLSGESASLRCYTRSHQCGGQNLSTNGPGYPTTQAFSTPLTNCNARTDACPNALDGDSPTDTAVPTTCSPLRNVKKLADHLKAVKASSDQILVAGIYGWPRRDETDANTWHPYKIDQVPNPTVGDTAHPTVFDSWPICYDPDHAPSGDGFDTVAAGWGATAGLRASAFVDQFGENGLKFSICEKDYSVAMKLVGDTAPKRWQTLCVPESVADASRTTAPGLQPDCRITFLTPVSDGAAISYQESAALPECPAGSSDGSVSTACWQTSIDSARCPTMSAAALISVLRPAADVAAGYADGTKLRVACKSSY